MAQQRETTTDRLIGVITNLKLERSNGELTARRGEGPTAEEGRLLFVQGQIVQAIVGRRSGSDALNWLSTWRQASYFFMPTSSPTNAAPLLSPASSSDGKTNYSGSLVPWNNTEPLPSEGAPPSDAPVATRTLPIATALIEQAGFSRSYRRLYLLIDGCRSIGELAHLLGKTPGEVESMLYNLKRLGVVR